MRSHAAGLCSYDNETGAHFDMLPQLVREKPIVRPCAAGNPKGMPHFNRTGELFRQFDLFWKEHDT